MKHLQTFIILVLFCAVLSGFLNPKIVKAQQQNIIPPLLQPNQIQPLPPPLPPQSQPGTPPPPPGPSNPLISQQIPFQTLLNNLTSSINTANQVSKMLTLGKIWITRTPSGEMDIKAGLLYQNIVVSVLHIDSNGNILPIGFNPHIYKNNLDIQAIRNHLLSIVNILKISPTAEFIEPELCWSFPITINNLIVSHLKIYYDGIHVVQDYAANQEMAYYGQ